jgi:hypothetical protein
MKLVLDVVEESIYIGFAKAQCPEPGSDNYNDYKFHHLMFHFLGILSQNVLNFSLLRMYRIPYLKKKEEPFTSE